MAEQSEDNKYVKCSKCKCKYINNYEHIKSDFGYNRLGEQFKCCIKCRAINREYTRKWYEKNKDTISANQKQHYNEHREQILEYKRNYDKKTTICDVCEKQVNLNHLTRHQKSHLCRRNQISIEPNSTKIIENKKVNEIQSTKLS